MMGKYLLVFFVSASFGALVTNVDETDVFQKGYTKGRESVLNSNVHLGGGNSPCSLLIPVSVLVEMVNTGVLDWHQACLAALKGKNDG
jgi:hypothetical protein